MTIAGICRYCLCTDEDPCFIRDGMGRRRGCMWVDAEQTICSMPLCQKKVAIEDRIFVEARRLPLALFELVVAA
jgi:hypothetical protein